jgi:hypothetical protein
MRALATGLLAGLVTGTLVTSLLAQPAPPEPNRDSAQAKVLNDSANAAVNEGRYDDAVRDYNAAYDITKDPILFFKVGVAFEKAGKCEAAVGYYRRYLQEGQPNPQLLQSVNDRIAACGPATGSAAGSAAAAVAGAATGSATGAGTGTETGTETGSQLGSGTGPGSGPGSGAELGSAQSPPDKPRISRDGAWLMVGGALAFITAGVVLAYSASSSEQDLQDLYVGLDGKTPKYDATTATRYQDLIDQGHRYQDLSWASFGIAAGFTAAAASWFVHDYNEARRWAVIPVATPQSTGVGASVRF